MIRKLSNAVVFVAALAGAAAIPLVAAAQEGLAPPRAGVSAPTSINSAAAAPGALAGGPETLYGAPEAPYATSPNRAYGGYRGYSNVGPPVETQLGGGWYGQPGAGAVSAAGGGVGEVVYSLPRSCKADGPYYRCGDVWYKPQYMGSSVSYVVVPGPL